MTDKQIIKQLVEHYKEICKSPFADGYTFRAFDGECAEKGFTSDDIKNYIEKEKQERKAKRTESIKSLKEKLKRKEQECEELKAEIKHYKQIAQYHGNLSVKYTNKSTKYKQTLIKIKEIAENVIKNVSDRCIEKTPMYSVHKQILQKISECEVDNA